MWVTSGTKDSLWTKSIMSLISRLAIRSKSVGSFLLDTYMTLMLHSWSSLSNTSAVKGVFLACALIMLDYWCISIEWGWWTSPISYAEILRKWSHWCKENLFINNTTTFITLHWSRLLFCISWVCWMFHGMLSFHMRFSKSLKWPHQYFKRQEGLKISKRFMRLKLQVCQYLSLTKRALGDYLQLPNEYYLHLGWKGSRFHHQ